MNQSELEKLSQEKLRAKEKSTITLVGIYIVLLLALLFFNIKDYLDDDEINKTSGIITLCAVGGLISILPGLKSIREEVKKRNWIVYQCLEN